MSLLKEITVLLDITDVSAEIYVELLAHDHVSIVELMTILNKDEEMVKKNLFTLKEKGLVSVRENDKDECIFQAVSVLQLEAIIDRQKKMIENIKKILPKVRPENKISFTKYEGIEDSKKAYNEILEEAIDTGEDILAFESSRDADVLGKEFIDSYIQRRIKFKINAKVICPNFAEDNVYKNTYDGTYTEIKLVPNLLLHSNINIVGNLIMTFTIAPPKGTLIYDPDTALSLKSVFKNRWDSLK